MSATATLSPPKTKDLCKVLTDTFRVSFPHLDKPHAMEAGATEKFSVTMLFGKDDAGLKALKAAAQAAIEKKWAGKPPKGLRSPFRDGNEKDYDGYKDTVYISSSSQDQPGCVDQTRNAIDARKIYAGCYARATVVAYGYDKAGNKGVAFALHNVQFAKNGEPFGSKKAATDDFDDIEGEDPNEPVIVAGEHGEPNW